MSKNAEKKAAVLSTIKHHGPIKALTLSVMVNIDEQSDSAPVTRGYVRELIEDGHPIGSDKNGYRLLQTAKEVQVYLNSLLKRQIALSTRIQNVYEGAKLEGLI